MAKESYYEHDIRRELDNLTTYKLPGSDTELVSRKAVKRILNLIFRGSRDLDLDNMLNIEVYNTLFEIYFPNANFEVYNDVRSMYYHIFLSKSWLYSKYESGGNNNAE